MVTEGGGGGNHDNSSFALELHSSYKSKQLAFYETLQALE